MVLLLCRAVLCPVRVLRPRVFVGKNIVRSHAGDVCVCLCLKFCGDFVVHGMCVSICGARSEAWRAGMF